MKKKFRTESKRLLDLVTHSIYTNKEIFLRELISNASDAIDKYHYGYLTEGYVERDYKIEVSFDEAERTITITDNGIGMTLEELQDHLGTIAKSGTKEFMDSHTDQEVIGQFGVGFYSSFIVSDLVDVYTKSVKDETGYHWSSNGVDSYTVEEDQALTDGTKIVLHLREDSEAFAFSKFLDEYVLQDLIHRYSDYVKYPIQMDVTEYNYEEDSSNPSEEVVHKTINSMVPLWKKNKKDISEEELNHFFKHKFEQFEDPLLTIHTKVEGKLTYNALLFVPKIAPMNFHAKSFEKGLKLYSKGIFIKDKAAELVPNWMQFVLGVVDSADLDLNISRELVQETKVLKEIGSALEKKVQKELLNLLAEDKEKYVAFFKEYGVHLKYGLYENYGEKKELLEDLLLFDTSTRTKITLNEYLEELKEDQKEIYYATGSSALQIESLPQMDVVKEKEIEVLYLTDEIDEFMIKILFKYKDHEFKSVNNAELNLKTEEEQSFLEEKKTTSKNLLEALKGELGDLVDDVVLSARLTDSPLCIVSADDLSFEMERVLSQIPGQSVKAKRILELNPKHELFTSIEEAYNKDTLSVGKYAKLLLLEALLIEGLKIDDPKTMVSHITKLIVENTK